MCGVWVVCERKVRAETYVVMTETLDGVEYLDGFHGSIPRAR